MITFNPPTFHPFHFISIFLILIPPAFSLNSDGLSLLALKSAIVSDPTRCLSTWVMSDPGPCHWFGVHCTRQRVTALTLTNLSLSGYIPSELGLLDSLTYLSLSYNNFSSTIPPHLFNATSVTFLDLSHNSLTGPVPAQITALTNLTTLDLSDNSLSGTLPEGLSELTQLQGMLDLSWNEFSGEVPPSYGKFNVMVSLNLRHNNLSGKIPQVGSLLNQGPTAFAGNPGLCGFPLSVPCVDETINPSLQNPVNPISSRVSPQVAVGKRVGTVSVQLVVAVLVVVGVVVLGSGILVISWVRVRRRYLEEGRGKSGREKGDVISHHVKIVVGDDHVIGNEEEGQNGKFTVLDEEGFGLELEDLLRASAYVIGKSRSGIVYRVVVGGGGKGSVTVGQPTVVAVRRLSEADDAALRYREFEAEVEAIGKVQHPNIVRLRAYYYANDEKLLVSDFVRNGSLYVALHGGPSNDLQPLSWTSRLKIAQGTARGLMHIHEITPKKYVHGNFKSSKVLLDEDLHPYVSGFGLNRLGGMSKSVNPSSRRPSLHQSVVMGSKVLGQSSVAYMAPEARSGGKLTQKCDVYSFGIVLMEILTGRLPDPEPENDGKPLETLVRKVFQEERPLSEIIDPALLHEVYAKKQVLATFHCALNCTDQDPELRPRMRTVSESLDCLKFQ